MFGLYMGGLDDKLTTFLSSGDGDDCEGWKREPFCTPSTNSPGERDCERLKREVGWPFFTPSTTSPGERDCERLKREVGWPLFTVFPSFAAEDDCKGLELGRGGSSSLALGGSLKNLGISGGLAK